MQILVIESDEYGAQVISFAARRRGHKTLIYKSVAEIPSRLPFEPSVAIIAVEGLEQTHLQPLFRLHERFPEVPLLVTAEDLGLPATTLFEAGVRQLVQKPYYPTEMIVRAEVVARSNGTRERASDVIRVQDLTVDLGRYAATKAGRLLPLTKLELRLLYSLASHHGQVGPTETLLAFGWDSSDPPNDSLLKTHISHLRMKLREAGGQPATIRSRHGVGYILTIEEQRSAEGLAPLQAQPQLAGA